MVRRKRVGRIFTVVLALALIDAGCGSTPASPTTTTTTTIPPDAPIVTLTPATLGFAATTGVQTVMLANTGAAELDITSIATSGNFAATNDCPAAMPVGATCTISATFQPLAATAPAASSGSVILTDNAPSSPQSVVLTGPAVTPANALFSPTSLTFGSQTIGSASSPQTITLTNPLNGTATVALGIRSVDAEGDFQIAQTTCGSALSAGNSCTVAVVFVPTAAGTRTGRLTVFDTAPVNLSIIALTGTGR